MPGRSDPGAVRSVDTDDEGTRSDREESKKTPGLSPLLVVMARASVTPSHRTARAPPTDAAKDCRIWEPVPGPLAPATAAGRAEGDGASSALTGIRHALQRKPMRGCSRAGEGRARAPFLRAE